MENTFGRANGFQADFLPGVEGFQEQRAASMGYHGQHTAVMVPSFPQTPQQIVRGYHLPRDEITSSYASTKVGFYTPSHDMLADHSSQQQVGNYYCSSSDNLPPQPCVQPSGAVLNSPERFVMPIHGSQQPDVGYCHHPGYAVTQYFINPQYRSANQVHQQGNDIPYSHIPSLSMPDSLHPVYRELRRIFVRGQDAQRNAYSAKRKREKLGSFTPPRMQSNKRRARERHISRELSESIGLRHSPTFQQDDMPLNVKQRAMDGVPMVQGFSALGEYSSAHYDMGSMSARSNDSMTVMSPYSALAKNSRGSTYPKITFEAPCTPHNFKHSRRISDPSTATPLSKRQKVCLGKDSTWPKKPAVPPFMPGPCSAARSSIFGSDSAAPSPMPNLGPPHPSSQALAGPAMPKRAFQQYFANYSIVLQPSASNQDSIDQACTNIRPEQLNLRTPSAEADILSITATPSVLTLSNTTSHHGIPDEASILREIPSHIPPCGGFSVGSSIVGGGPINPDDIVPSIAGAGGLITSEDVTPSIAGERGLGIANPPLLEDQNGQSNDPNVIEEPSDFLEGFGAYELDCQFFVSSWS